MIGPKKLSKIRQELQSEIDAAESDPIHMLEQRMASSEPRFVCNGENEVLRSLSRFLESEPGAKGRSKHALRRKK